MTVGLCTFPLFGFSFSLPGLPTSFSIPIPGFSFSLDLTCPLN